MAENEFKVPEEFQNLTLLQLNELGMWDEEWQIEGGLTIAGGPQMLPTTEPKEQRPKTLFERLRESGLKVHEAKDDAGGFSFIGYPMPKPKDDSPKEQTPEGPF